jgi:hydroxyacylglutathione hydrolase
MEAYNISGPPLLYSLPLLTPFNVEHVKRNQKQKAQLVDIRAPLSFAAAHIPRSISLWRKGIPMFAGWFLSYDKPIILIDDFNMQLDQVLRLFIRLGYDNVIGYLSGGFPSWQRADGDIESTSLWTVHDLKHHLDDPSLYILDVRDQQALDKLSGIQGAHHYYVGNLLDNLHHIPKDKHLLVYCDSGFKTSIASSLLKKNGFTNVTNLIGGIMAWKSAGYGR